MNPLVKASLTRKVFGFEQTYMYEILVTGPLGTSECAGECRSSVNLCKRALHITTDVIVEATRNADMLTINEELRSKNVHVHKSVRPNTQTLNSKKIRKNLSLHYKVAKD